MKYRAIIVAVGLALTLSFQVRAEDTATSGDQTSGDQTDQAEAVPKPSCTKPQKPTQGSSMKDYKTQVDAFKDCTGKYAKEQTALAKKYNAMAKAHEAAANDGIQMWNDFVSNEMQQSDPTSGATSGQK